MPACGGRSRPTLEQQAAACGLVSRQPTGLARHPTGPLGAGDVGAVGSTISASRRSSAAACERVATTSRMCLKVPSQPTSPTEHQRQSCQQRARSQLGGQGGVGRAASGRQHPGDQEDVAAAEVHAHEHQTPGVTWLHGGARSQPPTDAVDDAPLVRGIGSEHEQRRHIGSDAAACHDGRAADVRQAFHQDEECKFNHIVLARCGAPVLHARPAGVLVAIRGATAGLRRCPREPQRRSAFAGAYALQRRALEKSVSGVAASDEAAFRGAAGASQQPEPPRPGAVLEQSPIEPWKLRALFTSRAPMPG